jgi:hypothetical protein
VQGVANVLLMFFEFVQGDAECLLMCCYGVANVLLGDAECLPFEDASVDALTIGLHTKLNHTELIQH